MLLTIRPITPADIPIVQAMAYNYNLDLDPDETKREAVQRWIVSVCRKTQTGDHFFWLACVEESIIGFASCYLHTNPFTQETLGFIEDFYLVPASRGQGYAQKLANIAFSELQKRGASKIQLDVLATNSKALQFWQKLGLTIHHHVLNMPLGDAQH
jgi:ribosomal protein S18 acetylase RimI-like enzyme